MLLLLGTAAPEATARPSHRNHPQTEAAVKKDTAALEAFSDTTSASAQTPVPADESMNQQSHGVFDPSNYDDPISFYDALWTAGSIGGVLVAIFITLVTLTIFFLPLIVVIVLIRYLIRRHNDRVRLAEKAMETGNGPQEAEAIQSEPQPMEGDEQMWRRGIRNASIGLGLMVMFAFWDALPLSGVGALVLFYGLGQMAIVYSAKGGKFFRLKRPVYRDFYAGTTYSTRGGKDQTDGEEADRWQFGQEPSTDRDSKPQTTHETQTDR